MVALRDDLHSNLLERDAAIGAAILALVTREHALFLGPPGTAKSLLVRSVCERIEGASCFERLVTKFSTPEELFGPLSFRAPPVTPDRFAATIPLRRPGAGEEVRKMQLIDGKALAATVREGVARGAAEFLERTGRKPVLAVVLVGDDPASKTYVRNKKRGCKEVGIESREHLLPASAGQAELLDLVGALNADPAVDGILVQLPLPKQIDPDAVIEAIDPARDADGFHPSNLGRLMAGRPGVVPCTPLGCMRMLEHTGVSPVGARAVVVGRSIIVGKPMAALLLAANATVTVCHTRTRDLPDRVREAEILVAAAGRPGMIRGDWIREGAVVIDVGTNRLESGELVGDVEFEAAAARAAWISPVPGGVGPMTIACLLENTLAAARARAGIQ